MDLSTLAGNGILYTITRGGPRPGTFPRALVISTVKGTHSAMLEVEGADGRRYYTGFCTRDVVSAVAEGGAA